MPIRLIEQSDKQKILELDQHIFGKIDGGWRSKDFMHYFHQGTCFLYYEEHNPEEILGYIFSRPTSSHSFVSNIGVKKEYEGRGIGKKLMKMAMLKEEEQAKKRPFSMRLQVRENNLRALGFYHHLGYVETSRSSGLIQMEAKELPQLFKEKEKPASETPAPPKKSRNSSATSSFSHKPKTKADKPNTPPKPENPPLNQSNQPLYQRRSEKNNFFSFQVLASITGIALGGAFIAIGIICSIHALIGIGVGVCFCGLAGLSSYLFFSSKERNRKRDHPLEYAPSVI